MPTSRIFSKSNKDVCNQKMYLEKSMLLYTILIWFHVWSKLSYSKYVIWHETNARGCQLLFCRWSILGKNRKLDFSLNFLNKIKLRDVFFNSLLQEMILQVLSNFLICICNTTILRFSGSSSNFLTWYI